MATTKLSTDSIDLSTNAGALTIPSGTTASPVDVEYLVVAGGGGGGWGYGGGGGAGGYLTNFGATKVGLTIAAAYTITVGAKGEGGVAEFYPSTTNPTTGGNSVFSGGSGFTASGGGTGGNDGSAGTGGGSGGGASRNNPPGSGLQTPHVSPGAANGTPSSQGNIGGDGYYPGANSLGWFGGGGGGAGAAGENGIAAAQWNGGAGGVGLQNNIDGNNYFYAGGGGGAAVRISSGTIIGGAGGSSIGGTGGDFSTTIIQNEGTDASPVNRGSGGGGGGMFDGSDGSSTTGDGGDGSAGVVILRYPTANPITIGASLTHSSITIDSDTITTFTAGSDTISFGGVGAGRPSSPTEGLLRDNTTTGALEFYDGSLWQQISGTLVSDNPPSDNFNTVIWTSTGGNTDISITGVGFKPDFVWAKSRTDAYNHTLYDSVREAGTNHWLASDLSNSESSLAASAALYGYLGSFDNDGFTGKAGTSDNSYFNYNTNKNYVGWNWKAGGAKVPNNEGDITTQVSVNQAAGFSIVEYTGTGNGASKIGHGITAGAPDLIICKNASQSGYSWAVYSSALPSVTNNLFLDFSGFINQYQDRFSAVTSTTFTAGSNYPEVNGNNDDMIAYCWKSVPGYSKIGSYTWTATNYTAGPMVANLGFTPRFVMIKGTTVTSNWYIFDNMRGQTGTYVYQVPLAPDLPDAEQTTAQNVGYQSIQFNSNGFSAMVWNASGYTTGSTGLNEQNQTYLYFAIA